MTDYLTLAEVLAMHNDFIARYGGAPGIWAFSKPLSFVPRPAIMRI